MLIDERLHGLIGGLDSDAAPTAQQLEVFDSLEKEAQPLLAQAHELLAKDVAALNEMVSKLERPGDLHDRKGSEGCKVKHQDPKDVKGATGAASGPGFRLLGERLPRLREDTAAGIAVEERPFRAA